MRATLAVTGLGYGGAQTQIVRLAIWLNARGWRVRVVSLLPPRAYVQESQTSRDSVHSLGMSRRVPDPTALFRLVGLLGGERPLVLTSFMYHAKFLGRKVGRLARVPVVVSPILNENFGGRTRDLIMRLADFLADVAVVNSKLVGEELVRRRVVPGAELRVIPNSVDTARFAWTREERMEQRNVLGIDEKYLLWLAVG